MLLGNFRPQQPIRGGKATGTSVLGHIPKLGCSAFFSPFLQQRPAGPILPNLELSRLSLASRSAGFPRNSPNPFEHRHSFCNKPLHTVNNSDQSLSILGNYRTNERNTESLHLEPCRDTIDRSNNSAPFPLRPAVPVFSVFLFVSAADRIFPRWATICFDFATAAFLS